MVFENGSATFTVSTQIEDYQRVTIVGTKGWLEIEIPFNAPTDRPCRLWLTVGGETQEVTFETANQYTLQGDAFSKAVLEDTSVPTPIEDAVANMKVIEAVLKSGETGSWEAV